MHDQESGGGRGVGRSAMCSDGGESDARRAAKTSREDEETR
jgi:hypothetical protein